MKLYSITLFTALASLSANCYSADILIEPGEGTIQAAINAASSGDTLVLPSGSYSTYSSQSNQIVFDKALTVRAESGESVVHINASILTDPNLSEPLDYLRFQGVNLTPGGRCFGGYRAEISVNNLELLEVTSSCLNGLTLDAENEVTVIGSYIGIGFSINAKKATVLGSTIVEYGGVMSVNADETNFIGNEVTTYNVNTRGIIFSGNNSGGQFVAANRFNYRLTYGPSSDYQQSESKNTFSLIKSYGSNDNKSVYKNNVFKIDLTNFTDFTDAGTLERISLLATHAGHDYFYNNVFDLAGLAIAQPASPSDDLGPMIAGQLGAFMGNAIINYNDDVLGSNVNENAQYNLGFNNKEQLNVDSNNVNADPLFNADYSLKAGSPAIDAGPVDEYASDIDLTRNDIGVYGGSWNIGQYDVQRAPDATGPFIYPVLDAQAGIANGELKLKLISYPRLK